MRKRVTSLSTIVLLALVCVGPVLAQSGDTVPTVELSGAGIAAIVAVLTSVLLTYIPGLKAWWDTFTYKRESLGGVGLLVALALVGLHYLGALDLGLGSTFGWPVIWKVIEAWLAFSGAGQLSYTGQKMVESRET